MVILGKQAIDDDCNQTGQILSSLIDCHQATFASKVEVNDDRTINVTREVDGGLETIKISIPCVITTDLRLNEPRYASLPNIMKAKQKKIDTLDINELNIDLKKELKQSRLMNLQRENQELSLMTLTLLLINLKMRQT